MRSVYQVDVAAIAEAMGGGGHKRAAGFKTVGDLESVRAQVISKIQDALDRS
jgi:nanoRNase/pAp phosphatase (c-di-AMP/oligoRNAs hydrolase)